MDEDKHEFLSMAMDMMYEIDQPDVLRNKEQPLEVESFYRKLEDWLFPREGSATELDLHEAPLKNRFLNILKIYQAMKNAKTIYNRGFIDKSVTSKENESMVFDLEDVQSILEWFKTKTNINIVGSYKLPYQLSNFKEDDAQTDNDPMLCIIYGSGQHVPANVLGTPLKAAFTEGYIRDRLRELFRPFSMGANPKDTFAGHLRFSKVASFNDLQEVIKQAKADFQFFYIGCSKITGDRLHSYLKTKTSNLPRQNNAYIWANHAYDLRQVRIVYCTNFSENETEAALLTDHFNPCNVSIIEQDRCLCLNMIQGCKKQTYCIYVITFSWRVMPYFCWKGEVNTTRLHTNEAKWIVRLGKGEAAGTTEIYVYQETKYAHRLLSVTNKDTVLKMWDEESKQYVELKSLQKAILLIRIQDGHSYYLRKDGDNLVVVQMKSESIPDMGDQESTKDGYITIADYIMEVTVTSTRETERIETIGKTLDGEIKPSSDKEVIETTIVAETPNGKIRLQQRMYINLTLIASGNLFKSY